MPIVHEDANKGALLIEEMHPLGDGVPRNAVFDDSETEPPDDYTESVAKNDAFPDLST